jgi:RHS repeat-associated protein
VYGKTKNNASLKTHPKTGQAVDPKIRFQGQWEDLETGLYQNLHRFYDPHCGRYINHDPIGLMGGLNAYQYCPNPVEWIDPLGLCCKEVEAMQSRVSDAVARHGGVEVEGVNGLNNPYRDIKKTKQYGLQNSSGTKRMRDDFLGHPKFGENRPHFNVESWGEEGAFGNARF